MLTSSRFALVLTVLSALPARAAWAKTPIDPKAQAASASRQEKSGGVAAPVAGEPLRLLTAPGGEIYAQMPQGTVVGLASGSVVVDARSDAQGRPTTGRVVCAAGARSGGGKAGAGAAGGAGAKADVKAGAGGGSGGRKAARPVAPPPRIACLHVSATRDAEGQPASQTLTLTDSGGLRRTITSGEGERYQVEPLGVQLGAEGALRLVYAETREREGRVGKRYVLVDGDREVNVSEGFEVDRGEGPAMGEVEPGAHPVQLVEVGGQLWLVHQEGSAIVAHPPDEDPVEVASSAGPGFRAVVGPDGWLYVLYQEPVSGVARVAVSQEGRAWRSVTLGSRESGLELDAAAGPDAVYAVFTFGHGGVGGLRSVALRDGRRVSGDVTLARDDHDGVGRRPRLAIAPEGAGWLTFQRPTARSAQTWRRFTHPEELLDGAVERGTWLGEGHRSYYLETGAGSWLSFWHLGSPVPSLEAANGVFVEPPEYDVGMALLLSASVEARWKSAHFGLSYAQGVVDAAAENIGDSTGILTSAIKVDDVVWGHDLELSVLWGRYRGSTSVIVASGEGGAMEIRSSYVDTQLMAHNKWRIKYGLAYTHQNLPALVHTWISPERSTQYGFSGSFLRDVTFNNLSLMLGYSKLDHVDTHRDHYSGLFLDGALGGGVAFYSHDPANTSVGPIESGVTFHLRSNARVGWMLLHRWASLGGFGLYVRPSYVAEFGFTGLPTAPSSTEDEFETSTYSALSLLWLRHGPSIDVGAVW
ncbi:hypothetical protein [Chondromyces crocatus]|uniref:Autotransporter domain-containing protein n=1 Tax=Chondromyces crocatus TaxID=52 RepID=A0A0K1ECP7_CHOCO|nr:hypothetical protein [Chondromyces crocatus]AKT38353.1 uncharacterized protein CMC5_024990 [Chondromyces crocatus]